MSDCSNHKKEVAGIADMKALAEMIGDLHYATLTAFLQELSDKLRIDATKDEEGERYVLAAQLKSAAGYIIYAKQNIAIAWKISQPFMDSKPNKHE